MVQVIYFIFGLLVGSFLNVLADRLPKGQNVVWGRSRCDHCRRTLRWFELVPLLSFVFQLGKCRRCHTPLSFQYPIVEIATGLLFVYSYLQMPSNPLAAIFLGFLYSSLLVIFVADWKYTIIPDAMVVMGLVTQFLFLLLVSTSGNEFYNRFSTAIYSATAFLLLWSLTKGRGIGFGDVKLVLLLGFITGFPSILVTIYAGFLTGALVGVILILVGRKKIKSHIAFGPFLIIGYVISLIWGPQIIKFWMGYIR